MGSDMGTGEHETEQRQSKTGEEKMVENTFV